MTAWWSESWYHGHPLDVPFTRKNIIWLLVVHPPFPLVPPGPPCLGRLFVWSMGRESPRRVNEVDIVEGINNKFLPLIPRFSKINIQVSQDKGDAAHWTGFPGSPKIFHPHHVGGGGVYSHAIESLVASNKLGRE